MTTVQLDPAIRQSATGSGAAGSEPSNAPARAGTRARARVGGIGAWCVREFEPPDIVRGARPALRSTWLYGRHGAQCPPAGAARAAATVYSVAALPFRAAALYLDWLLERPARLAAAFAVYAMAAQTGVGGWLPWM